MGILGRIFGSGKQQPEDSRAAIKSAPMAERLTNEKDWFPPNLLRQLRELLRDAPIRNESPASVSLTRQLPAIWKGREDFFKLISTFLILGK